MDVGANISMYLFTDGSCQKAGASAAFIVKHNDDTLFKNVEVLPRGATNQHAELRAIEMALLWRRNAYHGAVAPSCKVITDSQYSIDCVTKWYKAWIKNNWKTTNNTDVKHRSIIESILSLVDERIEFVHVRSHTKKNDILSIGNAEVDCLATSVFT